MSFTDIFGILAALIAVLSFFFEINSFRELMNIFSKFTAGSKNKIKERDKEQKDTLKDKRSFSNKITLTFATLAGFAFQLAWRRGTVSGEE